MIRIEIGAMPRLLRSIVCSALETDGDMTVIARGEAGPGEADVVIVCGDRIAFRQLVEADPPTIVAIDSAGASATILRVTAECTPIGAASDLREAVRRAARRCVRAPN